LFFHEDNIKSVLVKGEEDETLYTSETDTWRWNDLHLATPLQTWSGLKQARILGQGRVWAFYRKDEVGGILAGGCGFR